MSKAGSAMGLMLPMDERDRTEALWQEVHEGLLAFIRRRVRSPQDAEDILQDVFLRIHRNIQRMDDVQNVAGWVFRTASNAIIDHYRRRAVQTSALDKEAVRQAAEQSGAEGESDAEAGRELAACLVPLLQRIPVPYRDAIAMTDLGGLTQKKAALHLGLTHSGMKARVQRGRTKLREALLDCCHVEFGRRNGVVDYQPRGDDCPDCGCGAMES